MTYKLDLTATLAVADASGVVPTAKTPEGTTKGKTRFSVLDSTGAVVQTQDVDGLEAQFTGLADGTFTASAQFLDSTGALLGAAVTTSFVDAVEVSPVAEGESYTPLATLSATVTAE
ncbi:hypothetical protein [Robbsia andropogonis]|uniref:hypothetical protein n=1 Tax=Robbsia andropogonis TaxID=28092 RepID=UPI00209F56B4|nr:hypothetical protein [Robbsia andropogonis]MCP1120094.1 hypothetical protein [Robbsia andropogonis]MCP1130074.1 hypothetical protein [Robbsia andropogonis]